jgi:hypothetical protein
MAKNRALSLISKNFATEPTFIRNFPDISTYSTLHLPSDDVDEVTQLPVIVYNAAFFN